jgi:threonine dehydrogenase-like Zn-dependent dehydrogenase
MRGVVFPGERAVETMTFPDPTPGPGEVVLEMKASGMCGSDLHQYRRPKNLPRTGSGIPPSADPVIAGHEPCGVVVAVGPGVTAAEARIGERMMVHHYQGCTQCSHCRSGWQHARVIALDTNPQRLERAREFGADELVNPGSNDPVEAIKQLTHGKYTDLSTRRATARPVSMPSAAPRCGAPCVSWAKAATSRSTSARTCSGAR